MGTSNPIRQALAEGKTVTGMILFTGSPMMIEMMAAAGVDFVIIDMEQSALDLDRAAHCIRAADASRVTPFVRVPNVDAPRVQLLVYGTDADLFMDAMRRLQRIKDDSSP